ncbi:MAG: beta-galactosidase [Planctomycetia bacterium]|nr:beta-galactosidase [Planctomycetia bacterium]
MTTRVHEDQASGQTRRTFIKESALAAIGLALWNCQPRPDVWTFAGQDGAESTLVGVNSPYGVCAHIGAGEEWSQAPNNLKLMRQAGIRWVRADFSWSAVEGPQGQWHFDHLDKILEQTEENQLQVLPILDYHVDWATPAYKHMDKWLEYVKRIVERYHTRLRYWEVWNEENLEGFWRDTPSGEEYGKFLRATYKAIKEIDPSLIVLYGGLAGTPVDFFEKSLDVQPDKEDFFDVVNIHPYRGGLTTATRIATFHDNIEAFRTALQKRDLPQKPIWITEMGWATPPVYGETTRIYLEAAFHKLFPDSTPTVAFYYDERYEPTSARLRQDFLSYLPARYAKKKELVSFINSDDIANGKLSDVEALIMPPSETFPEDCFQPVVEFVKNGGTLCLSGGLPLYYVDRLDPETNRYKRVGNNPNHHKNLEALRISWFAWWTRENVPEQAPIAVDDEVFRYLTEGASPDAFANVLPSIKATRFFDEKALHEGDQMISICDGKTDDFRASTACVYKFNSDYKGAVALCAIMDSGDGDDTNVTNVSKQAIFLPQSYLLAISFGIERYFWYEFHAPERDNVDKEHHFGIVGGPKLKPKPGYYAYKTMTKVRPEGSDNDKLEIIDDTVCKVSWRRPDGKTGWAIWDARIERKVQLEIDGEIDNACDYLGIHADLDRKNPSYLLSPEILYLVGPKDVRIKL